MKESPQILYIMDPSHHVFPAPEPLRGGTLLNWRRGMETEWLDYSWLLSWKEKGERPSPKHMDSFPGFLLNTNEPSLQIGEISKLNPNYLPVFEKDQKACRQLVEEILYNSMLKIGYLNKAIAAWKISLKTCSRAFSQVGWVAIETGCFKIQTSKSEDSQQPGNKEVWDITRCAGAIAVTQLLFWLLTNKEHFPGRLCLAQS